MLSENPKRALVLSGGGGRGAYHVGVLRFVWVNCWSGLYKLDSTGTLMKVVLKLLPDSKILRDEFVNQIISDPKGYVWGITNFARLYRFDIKTNEVEIKSPAGISGNNFFSNLTRDEQGVIWMGTNMGLFSFDPRTNKTDSFNDLSSKDYQYSSINTLAMDSFGSLWIGSNSTGMYKYEERSLFKSFSNNKEDPRSLTAGWVNNIHELSDGKILVTTSGGGLNIIDLK